MTREEAITTLGNFKRYISGGGVTDLKANEAIDMAIEVLQEKPTKAVSPSLADVYKWERDIALLQLEEYGIGFAEKKRDDLVKVVRCKDCRFNKYPSNDLCLIKKAGIYPDDDDFCSYGEKEKK